MDSKQTQTPEEVFEAIMESLDAGQEGRDFLARQVATNKQKKKRQPRKKVDTKPSMTVERKEVIIEFK